jgi:hypothetical protein
MPACSFTMDLAFSQTDETPVSLCFRAPSESTVAKDIDRGIAALDGCSRLIVDLRGNAGGGIGGLRLMSYLTPGKLEVGYSLRGNVASTVFGVRN